MEHTEPLETVFSSFEGKQEELIPILQQVQGKLGYVPEEAMREVARFTGVPESSVYAVATFYTQFRLTPIGRTHVKVCQGTSCHVQGGPRILEAVEEQLGIKPGEATPDREFSLETVGCVGACGQSPCMMVNNDVQAQLTPERVTERFGKAAKHDGES
jgi:NADH-quinone oxidoreductase subunit E